MMKSGFSQPAVAGIISALVAFTSSFVVVLSGLRSAGAGEAEAANGLLASSIAAGLVCIILSATTRMPLVAAWSTPGAALLMTTDALEGGWPSAIGAFLVTGALIILTALIPQMSYIVQLIPPPVAQAMLAGILFHLCLGIVDGLTLTPITVIPVVAVWLLASRWIPRWAVPLAFGMAAAMIGVNLVISGQSISVQNIVPQLTVTVPEFSIGAVLQLSIPLYIVAMASQNIPGAAIMRNFGYNIPWRESLISTGLATTVGASAGVHTINLAAISAALAAGPEAGADRTKRWFAGVSAGVTMILLGISSSALASYTQLAPEGLIAAVAGIALLSPMALALKTSFANTRTPAVAALTFVIAASGLSIGPVSGAVCALIAGTLASIVLSRK